MTPATTSAPPLTAPDGQSQHGRPSAREALLEFVRELARQQAMEDHLREAGQNAIYDPRRDLRPL